MNVPVSGRVHRQGSNTPRAGFYFIREKPELLTGARVAQSLATYLRAIQKVETDRFRSFLAFVEDDPRVPESRRAFPRHEFMLPGEIRRVPLGVSFQALRDKLRHLHGPPGTPSVRSQRYHLPEHCVLYLGGFTFHLVNARYNLEETGILRRKWMDFCIASSMLIPVSERKAPGYLPPGERVRSILEVNCFRPERFNSDSLDHFLELVGFFGGERLSFEEGLKRLGHTEGAEEESPNREDDLLC